MVSKPKETGSFSKKSPESQNLFVRRDCFYQEVSHTDGEEERCLQPMKTPTSRSYPRSIAAFTCTVFVKCSVVTETAEKPRAAPTLSRWWSAKPGSHDSSGALAPFGISAGTRTRDPASFC